MVGRALALPTAAARGLDCIREAVELEPERRASPQAPRRGRQVPGPPRSRGPEPELATGRARGLVFGPAGHRLAVLSDDDEELAFWDVEHGTAAERRFASRRVAARAGPAEPVLERDRERRPRRNRPVSRTGLEHESERHAAICRVPVPPAPPELVRQPARGSSADSSWPRFLPDDRGVALCRSVCPARRSASLIPPDRTVLGVARRPRR